MLEGWGDEAQDGKMVLVQQQQQRLWSGYRWNMPVTRGKKRTKQISRTVDPAILRDIVRRVVEAASPDKIILFGSAARGDMGPHSDLDLLVIKGGKFHRRRTTDAIYEQLRERRGDLPVDVVVVTPEEVERYADTECLVICPAVKEGRVVYGS